MHMKSNSDLTHEEKRNISEIQTIFTIITAIGTLTTTEETTVYVRDLEMFDTVELLEDTPAVSLPEQLMRKTWVF